MEEKALISIIVPVFNTSKYLPHCLDSILHQTYKNIEVIIVDDGSTDDSLKIIKKYAKENSNIRYFTQKNCGQATARNKGVKFANGDYIMFVDSDDYVSDEFCQVAYESICSYNTEIALFDICTISSNNARYGITFNLKEGFLSKEDALSTTIYSSFPFNKIYKKKLFENIEYPANKKYEDLFTTYKLINTANSISYVKKALYYYVQRDDSTVHQFTTQNMTDYFNANQQLFSFFAKNYPRLEKKMINSVLQGSLYFLAYAGEETDQELINQAHQNLINLPLKKSLAMKWRLILRMYKIFPSLTVSLFKKKVMTQK